MEYFVGFVVGVVFGSVGMYVAFRSVIRALTVPQQSEPQDMQVVQVATKKRSGTMFD